MESMLMEYKPFLFLNEEEVRNLLDKSLSKMEEIAESISTTPQKNLANFLTYIKHHDTFKEDINFYGIELPEKEIKSLEKRANDSYKKFAEAWEEYYTLK